MARMRLRALCLSLSKSLTGTRRRRLVGILKFKEGGGKKLKQLGQGGFLMYGEPRFVNMTEATCSQKWISITRTSYCLVAHRRSVDCQVLGRFACVKGCDKPQRLAPPA
jgi:hypothetical protein